jgi:ferredoxin
MTTEYQVRLDREICDGVFACLVRDDRFAEASDGLATIAGTDGDDELTARFTDDRLDDARQAARACPVGAIDVTAVDDE